MEYSMVWVRGHIEVYDGAGRFCFSADNEREAWEELEARPDVLPSPASDAVSLERPLLHRSIPVRAHTPRSKGCRTFLISVR